MRMFLFVACLASIALAAEAAIPQPSPEAAVRDVYAADALSLRDNGLGAFSDPSARQRLFSRSLLRAIGAAAEIPADPFSDFVAASGRSQGRRDFRERNRSARSALTLRAATARAST